MTCAESCIPVLAISKDGPIPVFLNIDMIYMIQAHCYAILLTPGADQKVADMQYQKHIQRINIFL